MTKYQKKVGELESSVEKLVKLGAEMNELKKRFLNQNYTRNEYFTHDIQKNTILTTEQLLTTTTGWFFRNVKKGPKMAKKWLKMTKINLFRTKMT